MECREYQDASRLNRGGYARGPWGAVRVDSLGRRRGRTPMLLHRWIVEQVEGPLRPGEVVMHTCDNPPCFLYAHLRRATQPENIRDMEAKGRGRRLLGTAHPNAKLTDDQVRAIRAIYGSEPQRSIAAWFGVSRELVRKIGRGQHR